MEQNEVDVVLVSPVFFRGAGSRNNKASVSLMYMSAWLKKAGISHVVYNADHVQSPPGGNAYLRWRQLFYHFDKWFKPVVDGDSPLYGEMYEQILSWKPKMVVIQSSEPLLPTVDWGNAWIGENLAKMLKRRGGIHVVGSGLFYSLDRRFDESFDAMIVGEPGIAVVGVFRNMTRGIVHDKFEDVVPCTEYLWPADQNTEQVMASRGCSQKCAFCLTSQMNCHQCDIGVGHVVADVAQRKESNLYFGDMNFPRHPARMQDLAQGLDLADLHKRFSCEARTDSLTPEKLDLMQRIGIKSVKIGVESISQVALDQMKKHQTPEKIRTAVNMLRDRGMDVVAYLILGGHMPDDSYNATLDFCRSIGFKHYVVNVWSYEDIRTRDYRYDTHFSMECARRWGVRPDTLEKFFDLQASTQSPTLGRLVD